MGASLAPDRENAGRGGIRAEFGCGCCPIKPRRGRGVRGHGWCDRSLLSERCWKQAFRAHARSVRVHVALPSKMPAAAQSFAQPSMSQKTTTSSTL